MQVVVIGCDDDGNVDLADLEAKAEQHAERPRRVMITYPVDPRRVRGRVNELCAIVHRHGGQVYVDGANMNAMVGLAAPGEFGGDVCHLNLHKTFCIPHGGGGPGVGPVASSPTWRPSCRATPAAAVAAGRRRGLGGAARQRRDPADLVDVHRMMGGEGLTSATEAAILNANYIAARLRRPLRAALQRRRRGRRRRPRVHPRPAAAEGRDRRPQGSASRTSPSA